MTNAVKFPEKSFSEIYARTYDFHGQLHLFSFRTSFASKS